MQNIKNQVDHFTTNTLLALFLLLPIFLILATVAIVSLLIKETGFSFQNILVLIGGLSLALFLLLFFYRLVSHVTQILRVVAAEEDRFKNIETLFQILCKLNPNMVIIQDAKGVIKEVKGQYKILGFEKNKLIGHNLLDRLNRSVDANFLPFISPHPLTKPFVQGKSVDDLLIGFLREKDKNLRWLRLYSKPVIDAKSRKVKKVITILVDVTDDKMMEDELKLKKSELSRTKQREAKEQAKYKALISSIGDGLIITDWEGIITMINEQAEKKFCLNHGEAVGKFFHELVVLLDDKGEKIPPAKQPIHQTILTGKRFVSDKYTFICRDQSKFPASIVAAPVILEGKIFGSIMLFKDITREKEIDRMKTEFISLASHQLRTPLSAMKWFLEMLLAGDAGKLSSEQRDFIENINQANERMIDLVNGLLNISRIESGRLIIDPRPTDLAKLVKDVIDELSVKFKEKNQTPVVSIHKKLPKIKIDPKLIRHVYMNLLTNAIKYSPKDTEIEIFVSRKGEEIISQITDHGYGIPANQQHKVFQKFFRGDNIIAVETDGTGLGLYLVKAIVESSGGRIWFRSEENKGTTFWFTLPLKGSKPHRGEVSLDT